MDGAEIITGNWGGLAGKNALPDKGRKGHARTGHGSVMGLVGRLRWQEA